MEKQHLALYLAGLIDGDGTVEIRKRKKPPYSAIVYEEGIRIASSDRAFLETIQQKLNLGGRVYCNRKGWGRRRDGYSLYWDSGNTRKVLKMVVPYLLLKREEAKAALALGNRRGRWKGKGKRKMSQGELEAREALYQEWKRARTERLSS